MRSVTASISGAVLSCLASKKYDIRHDAAMELSKIIGICFQNGEYERVTNIIVFLGEDYVRSMSENARKGGVMALAAATIPLSKGECQLWRLSYMVEIARSPT